MRFLSSKAISNHSLRQILNNRAYPHPKVLDRELVLLVPLQLLVKDMLRQMLAIIGRYLQTVSLGSPHTRSVKQHRHPQQMWIPQGASREQIPAHDKDIINKEYLGIMLRLDRYSLKNIYF